ncbi:glutathione S-transferase family protein [uncultured Litoreibacter sp.]|uniref:glutathione S-transferase family protein n=1 Tax=uncultured Litoreibacter sp. TaxID=1392394 RepID=UPI00263917E9|nr:glutathione S-transferase family protein [uncultured Litoreibacter sp.]
MTIALYSVSGAPSPWRVQIGLTFKGLAFDLTTLSAQKQEHKSPEFLKLNPRGTVPVLIDGDTQLTDSIGILGWLDRAYPDRPLFGATPSQSAVIWQRVMSIAEFLPPAVSGVLRPLFFGGETEATDALREAAQALTDELAIPESYLSEGAFLAGANPTAADAVMFPHIRLLVRGTQTHAATMEALGLGDLPALFPNLAAWVNRVEALPNVAATFPPHWQDAT